MVAIQVKTQETALDLYDRYTRFINSNAKANAEHILKSAVVRFLVPAYEGPSPTNKRSTAQEVVDGLNYLKNLTPQQIVNALDFVEKEFEAKNIDKDTRRRNRSTLKSFAEWTSEQGYGAFGSLEEEEFKYERLHAPSGKARWEENLRLGRDKKSPYALGAKCFPDDYINQNLLQDFESYQKYRLSCACSPKTIKDEVSKLYQILGWLHRFKNVPLASLRLTSIVEFSPLNILLSKGLDRNSQQVKDYFVDQMLTKNEATITANKTLNLIHEYLDFLGGHSKSREKYVNTVLALAKFIFRNEFGTEDYPEDRDIPVIRKLRDLKKKLAKEGKATPQTIPYEKKSVPWTKAVEVMEKVRQRHEKKCTYSTTVRDGITRKKRTDYALARDLQDFLSLAFMILIPPDRARTYYELELGRTLVYGHFADGCFMPAKSLNLSDKFKWYIHLQPLDYKTGKIHGEYWGEIPNTVFNNGKCFYEYMLEWLVLRKIILENSEHNCFFIKKKTALHEPLDEKNWNDRIMQLFRREAGVPVAPHQLRSMYITYLNEIGASPNEKRGAAIAMHHTEQMQEKVYNRQGVESKLAPIVQRHAQETSKLLKKINSSEF